ncbi:shiftless antiviral inhibitor of ribosomal frameshifting protein homolog [Denticeps clupeoides]|uniref:Uncharacterized protein n=1 Tax=Denticeps clupeoides TaxID=299321 RepID=A0AAY4E499_9TELE|nr:repressor of yield of DENV protein [Denticeps clupeoides]
MSAIQEEVELETSVRRLREQFHGKIDIERATILMRRYGNNHRLIAMEIVLMKDRELDEEDIHILKNDTAVKNVVRKLKAEETAKETSAGQPSPAQGATNESPERRRRRSTSREHAAPSTDHDIQELGKLLRALPLTQENLRMFDNAQKNRIPSDIHQFACETCDSDWWRRVPQRKRVSRCQKCKKKYDPVPADKMWGLAEFFCPNCARNFRGFGRMDVGSPCYSCRSVIMPTKILPPRRRTPGLPFQRRNPHSCLAEDCYNRQEPHVPGTECVHPHSRMKNHKPRVVNPSQPHISSGSTVNTCLSQGSLADLYSLVRDDLEGISEEEEEDEEAESNSSSSSGSS